MSNILSSPDSVLLGHVRQLWPMPEDPFAVVAWAQTLERSADVLADYANRIFNEYVLTIYEEGLTSSEYTLEFPVERVESVDSTALAEFFPAVYEDLVFVPGADVLRILGREKTYALCMQHDVERTVNAEQVNLTDLRRVLRGEDLLSCIRVTEKPKRPVIRRMEDAS